MEENIMKYEFPTIMNIRDVLPAITGSPEFVVAEREGYTVVNYNVMMPDTFPAIKVAGGSAKMRAERSLHNKLRRECRGIIFCSVTGDVLRRPLHKFFNVNERDEVQHNVLDLSQQHVVLAKLDGSMIVPFMLNGEVRWGTKMGLTDVAGPAEEFARNNPKYEAFAKEMLRWGTTPIFEWCSRKQRIVLDYGQEDQLILTAQRNTVYGTYQPQDLMEETARQWDIPVVKAFESVTDMKEFLAYVAGLEDLEGFVVRFDDGHMVKVKCDWYCQIHRAKEAILHDRNIVAMILSGTIDDVKAHLQPEDRVRIEAFESQVGTRINDLAGELQHAVTTMNRSGIDRKNFSLNHSHNYDPLMKSAIFSAFDGVTEEQARDVIIKYVGNKLSNNKNYELLTEDWFQWIQYNGR